ncbi:MAG TPA: HIT domain-containing protein [Acidobacteriaceae bacterium]|nr:HIT domain-containing protein [Acidobacteriaceae bacterium]
MERLWTPWRYDYITRAKQSGHPGVPEALSAWPGPQPDPEGGPDSSAPPGHAGCVFCNMIAAADYAIDQGMAADEAERAIHLVARGPTCFLCLNAFPYSTGHVLLVPYRHVDSLAALTLEESREMMALAQQVERALTAVYHPSGMNFGLNLGEAGGAGIAAHLHLHALPRWVGDANFMTVTADTRILPEALDTTWEKLRAVWPPQ